MKTQDSLPRSREPARGWKAFYPSPPLQPLHPLPRAEAVSACMPDLYVRPFNHPSISIYYICLSACVSVYPTMHLFIHVHAIVFFPTPLYLINIYPILSELVCPFRWV